MKRFLIAHHNREMREMLNLALSKAFADEAVIFQSSHRADAFAKCKELNFNVDLVIVSQQLAAQHDAAVSDKQGLELVRILREGDLTGRVIVLAPTRSWHVEQAVLGGGWAIYEDQIRSPLDEEVVFHAKCVKKGPAEKLDDHRLMVEINLAHHTFTIEDRCGAMPTRSGELHFSQEVIENSRKLLDRINQQESDWEVDLRKIGKTLTRELYHSVANMAFHDACLLANQKYNLRENAARVRFVIRERAQHSIALEALLTLDCDEFWMLQAPLFRSVMLDSESGWPSERPLFEDRNRHTPINCLLINADTQGTVGQLQHTLPQLFRTKEECERVQEELNLNKDVLNIGEIRLLSNDEPSPQDWACWENVQDVLRSQQWHIVHYAGHSLYKHQCGYIFLPKKHSGTPQPIRAREFAGAFDQPPQFVYLSSCKSSADGFVFELAKIVPAVAGFRWVVEENAAFEYSKSFYHHLLKERCLEVAFWRARKEIHEQAQFQRDLVWAGAMLIL